jgi:Flp pilus assembly protein protease CpaA
LAKFAAVGQNDPMLLTPSELSVALVVMSAVLGAVVVVAAWVYRDAKSQAASGYPVVYSAGTLHIKTPVAWFLACTLLFEVFVPAYLDNRRFA